jgi:hypothetical protein
MSRTTIFAAPESGPFVPVAEFQNSWGSAMYVWNALGKKYFGNDCYVLFSADSFWPLWKDPRLTEDERATFVSTFDKCLVRAGDARRLAKLFREFVRRHPRAGVVCHLPAMADVLDDLPARCDGFAPAAVGWRQTSVSENPWWVRTGEDEGRPYDLSLDAGHFFLFEELDRRVPVESL